tara:strand:- start:2547 stop:4034 length:1488 start_codon:yes stop_codon:yes gene_type:complete
MRGNLVNNKKVIGLLLAGVVFFGGAPYLVGDMARNTLQQQAEQISEIPGYALNIKSYDQGWFTSHAVITYGFDQHTLNIMQKDTADKSPEDDALLSLLKEGLTFDLNIAHGPVTFQNGINFALMTLDGKLQDINHEAYKTFKQKAQINSLMQLAAKVSYGGSTTIEMNSPAFKADYSDIAGQRLIIAYDGMTASTTINAAMDKYDAHVTLNKMNLENDKVKVVMGLIQADVSGDKLNDHLWLGKGTTTFTEMMIMMPTGNLQLKNLYSEYDLAKESEKALTLKALLSSKEFSIPQLSLKDVTLDIEANHLDLAAVTDYVKSIQALYKTEDGSPPTEQEIAVKTQRIATRVGEQLIKGSPEIIIKKLDFSMGNGRLQGTSKLNINGENLQNIKVLSDPVALNKRLINTTDITFDKPLATAIMELTMKQQMAAAGMDLSALPPEQLSQTVKVQTSMMLQQMVNQGYFTQNGDTFNSHFEMKDGKRLINGKQLALPGM